MGTEKAGTPCHNAVRPAWCNKKDAISNNFIMESACLSPHTCIQTHPMTNYFFTLWQITFLNIMNGEHVQGCIQTFPNWVDYEINNNNKNKHSLRSNTKGYGGKTH
jgi:hypothetical protein